MTKFRIRPEGFEDIGAADALAADAFGPGRFAKSAYRLREGVRPVGGLSFVAEADGGAIVGTVRYWPIVIGDKPALILGPLAIAPGRQGQGIGLALMQASLEAARAAGHRLVILVGDEPYYARAGFSKLPRGTLQFPGPVNPDRLLGLALVQGALEGLQGAVMRAQLDETPAAGGAAVGG